VWCSRPMCAACRPGASTSSSSRWGCASRGPRSVGSPGCLTSRSPRSASARWTAATREVRGLAIADQQRHLANRRRLAREQLGGVAQGHVAQVAAERRLPHLREGALQLPGRAGERPRDDGHGQRPPIMAQDDRTALPDRALPGLGRTRPMDHRRAERGMTGRSTHTPYSERNRQNGTPAPPCYCFPREVAGSNTDCADRTRETLTASRRDPTPATSSPATEPRAGREQHLLEGVDAAHASYPSMRQRRRSGARETYADACWGARRHTQPRHRTYSWASVAGAGHAQASGLRDWPRRWCCRSPGRRPHGGRFSGRSYAASQEGLTRRAE
jgi:hypothetical protein